MSGTKKLIKCINILSDSIVTNHMYIRLRLKHIWQKFGYLLGGWWEWRYWKISITTPLLQTKGSTVNTAIQEDELTYAWKIEYIQSDYGEKFAKGLD